MVPKVNVGELVRNDGNIRQGSPAALAQEHLCSTCAMNQDIIALGKVASGGQKQENSTIPKEPAVAPKQTPQIVPDGSANLLS